MVVHIHSVRTEQSRAIDSNDVGSGATLKRNLGLQDSAFSKCCVRESMREAARRMSQTKRSTGPIFACTYSIDIPAQR